MTGDWITVGLKVILFCCVVFLGWAEYPLAVKTINSYIDHRVEERLASSIHVNGEPPPVKELDGYDLNRQPVP